MLKKGNKEGRVQNNTETQVGIKKINDERIWKKDEQRNGKGDRFATSSKRYSRKEKNSVGDPDQDPYVFGPPGSGSISQRYGSGSGSFPSLIKVLIELK